MINNPLQGLNPRAHIDRLNVSSSLGGSGKKEVTETIESEDRSLIEYIGEEEDAPLPAAMRAGELYARKRTVVKKSDYRGTIREMA